MNNDATPANVRLTDGLSVTAAEARKRTEKQFRRKLSSAGWFTYVDDESGRVVTNAHGNEVAKLASISGLPCEVVSAGLDGGCCKVGPCL